MPETYFPEHLKDGDFVAFCPHFKIYDCVIRPDEHSMWGPGGTARNLEDESKTMIFAATLNCSDCDASRGTSENVEYRNAQFRNGRLETGGWKFVPNNPIGRPKKNAVSSTC